MNHDWNPSPDPLVVRHLPTGRESSDWCELSERVNELPRSWATYESIRYVVILIVFAAVIGVLPRYAGGTDWSDTPIFWSLVLAAKLGFCFVLYLSGASRLRSWLGLTAVWVLLGGLLWLQAEAPGHSPGYLVLFPIAVGGSAWVAFLVSTQFAFYAAANLNNEWFVSDAWRSDWLDFTAGKPPKHRSEFPPMSRSLVALGIALCIGAIVNERIGFGAVGFLASLLLIAPYFWPKATDLVDCFASSWRACEVFLTYERKPCVAPGVFRFPTRVLRPHLRRIVAVFVPFLLVALSVGTTLPAKWPQPPSYAFIERPSLPPETRTLPPMTRIELDHFDRIAFRGEQDVYLSLVRRRRAHEEAVFVTEQKNFERTALTTMVACVVIPPPVVFGTLVFLFGPALAAYRRNLDGSPQA